MNLFDVTRGHTPYIGRMGYGKRNDGPRKANKAEIEAYLRWIAAKRGIEVPRDATFQPDGIWSEEEGHILPMPGHGDQPRVTLETLDESGAVISSQTLPVEPKKGGVIWDKAAVRRAYGPVEKPAKAKATRKARAKAVPPIVEMAPAEPVERVEAISATHMAPDSVEALSGPDIGNEPVSEAYTLPEVATVKDGLTVDPVAALAARLADLEARVAALPVEIVHTPTAGERQPRRTAAHERAIRRAWAARRSARLQRSVAEDHLRMRDQVQEALRAVSAECDAARDELQSQNAYAQRLEGKLIAAESHQRAMAEQLQRMVDKRQRAVMLARDLGKRLSAEHRLVDRYQAKRREAEDAARGARQRSDALAAELAKLRADLADPSQPERASDIARLVRERDEARVALAAVSARNAALQGSVNDLAERFEGMVSRVTRAEAALRAVGAGTPLPLPAPRMAPVAVPVPLSA